MKNTRGLPLITAGLLLVAAALSISAYNLWDENRAAQAAESTLATLRPMIPEPAWFQETQENPLEMVIPDYILNPNMDMPVAHVGDFDYVGYLSIPAVEIELPVMDQWSYQQLKESPCRYTGTAYQNSMVIAAHNYKRHFGRLSELNVGDRVEFTDMDGNIFHYEVGELEQLEAAEIGKMVHSDWDLTLFTCTTGGKLRFTVRCTLAQEI